MSLRCVCGSDEFKVVRGHHVPHRAFRRLFVDADWFVCACGEAYFGEDWDDCVDAAYGKELRARLAPLLEGRRNMHIERLLGLNPGDVRRSMTSTAVDDDVTRLLAGVLALLFTLEGKDLPADGYMDPAPPKRALPKAVGYNYSVRKQELDDE